MSERTASSSAASVPDQRGALRARQRRWHPACRARASRGPGQTTRPRRAGGAYAAGPAVRLQARGGVSPPLQAALAVASISPVRWPTAGGRSGVCVQLHAQLCLPHTGRGARLVAAVDTGVMVVTLPGLQPWPVLTLVVSAGGSALKMRKSPWVRRRLAVARRDSVESTFHWPSSSRSVASPRRTSKGAAPAWARWAMWRRHRGRRCWVRR